MTKIVYMTAGAAGMYCGSCMHDNALARSLRAAGADCVLQPVYTPVRTDGVSVASERVFFGGIQIYLLSRFGWFHRVPGSIRSMLDRPGLLRLATRRAASTDPARLGKLAVSMLRGEHGEQADEVARLTDWLADEMKPQMVVLSNLLIGGALPTIRRRLPDAKLVVMLQGDDIFLDHLPRDARGEAIRLCSELVDSVDHFIVNSHFYGEKMSALLGIADDRWQVHPLSIDLAPFETHSEVTAPRRDDVFRIGYLARLAPEKGLHQLVDAFIGLAGRPENADVELHIAGWLGRHNESYLETLIGRIAKAGLSDRFVHHGSPDLETKIRFLHSLDVLSVPTDYEDPKGLFVLEALAAGVPVVQPDHGAFGELIESTGGGLTYPCDAPDQLAARLQQIKQDVPLRERLAAAGRNAVREKHGITSAAQRLLDLLK